MNDAQARFKELFDLPAYMYTDKISTFYKKQWCVDVIALDKYLLRTYATDYNESKESCHTFIERKFGKEAAEFIETHM